MESTFKRKTKYSRDARIQKYIEYTFEMVFFNTSNDGIVVFYWKRRC